MRAFLFSVKVNNASQSQKTSSSLFLSSEFSETEQRDPESIVLKHLSWWILNNQEYTYKNWIAKVTRKYHRQNNTTYKNLFKSWLIVSSLKKKKRKETIKVEKNLKKKEKKTEKDLRFSGKKYKICTLRNKQELNTNLN